MVGTFVRKLSGCVMWYLSKPSTIMENFNCSQVRTCMHLDGNENQCLIWTDIGSQQQKLFQVSLKSAKKLSSCYWNVCCFTNNFQRTFEETKVVQIQKGSSCPPNDDILSFMREHSYITIMWPWVAFGGREEFAPLEPKNRPRMRLAKGPKGLSTNRCGIEAESPTFDMNFF